MSIRGGRVKVRMKTSFTSALGVNRSRIVCLALSIKPRASTCRRTTLTPVEVSDMSLKGKSIHFTHGAKVSFMKKITEQVLKATAIVTMKLHQFRVSWFSNQAGSLNRKVHFQPTMAK